MRGDRMDTEKIYNENCLDTMSRMTDGFIDLTVTSPPYDNLRKYNGYSFDFESIAKELYRVTKDGGVVVWVVGDATVNGSESGTSFRQALFFMECGFKLHDTMIYAKKNFVPLTHNRYEQAWEYMFIFAKGRPKTFNGLRETSATFGNSYNFSKKGSNIKEGSFRRRDEVVVTAETKLHTNIFYYSTGADKVGHPAPFPEPLATDHIHSWSNEGDLVYDPFGGSGTVAKMSHILKRKWILSEISEEYVGIAQKRIAPYLSQLVLL